MKGIRFMKPRYLASLRPLFFAFILPIFFLGLGVPAATGNLPAIPARALEGITPAQLRKHLEFLASDELGGRYTLSAGNKIAARYLAAQLESSGYRGAAGSQNRSDEAFFQRIAFNVTSLDTAKSSATLVVDGKRSKLKVGDDFRVGQPISADLTGDLVYVGYGIDSPASKLDDYAGLEVKGKIALLLPGTPPMLQGQRRTSREWGVFAAANHGASAALMLPSKQVSEGWAKASPSSANERAVMVRGERSGFQLPIPLVTVSPRIADLILEGGGKSLSAIHASLAAAQIPALKLNQRSAGLHLELHSRQEEGQNVVAILEGTAPNLRSEYVAFSAHFDHVESRDGVIYNGADDDGSGTVAVLEIARAFSIERPRRSILIIFHTGEEMGLLGSQFFTDIEPLVPLQNIVADLNIDMIGRSRKPGDTNPRNDELTDANEVYVIGSGRISSQLREINDQTAAELGRVKLNYRYEENDVHRFYSRSDHFNYAKHGIPVAFFFTGEHEDYHRPTDDVDKIDFDKMSRITQMIFGTGWRVANLDQRLSINPKSSP